MADIIFANARRKALNGTINLSNANNYKLALMSTNYTPSTSHQSWADVSSYEVSGTGYTQNGIALTGVSLTETSGVVTWTFSSPVWSNCTLSGVRYGIIYEAVASVLIKCIDFGMALNISTGPFTINVPTSGVLQWT